MPENIFEICVELGETECGARVSTSYVEDGPEAMYAKFSVHFPDKTFPDTVVMVDDNGDWIEEGKGVTPLSTAIGTSIELYDMEH